MLSHKRINIRSVLYEYNNGQFCYTQFDCSHFRYAWFHCSQFQYSQLHHTSLLYDHFILTHSYYPLYQCAHHQYIHCQYNQCQYTHYQYTQCQYTHCQYTHCQYTHCWYKFHWYGYSYWMCLTADSLIIHLLTGLTLYLVMRWRVPFHPNLSWLQVHGRWNCLRVYPFCIVYALSVVKPLCFIQINLALSKSR